MRVRILKPTFKLEFDGAPAVWNDYLRPILGGPPAPPDPVQAPAPALAAAVVPGAGVQAPSAPPPIVRTFAPPEPPAAPGTGLAEAAAAPAARPGVRTWYPPREPRPAREDFDDRAAPGDDDDEGGDKPWRRRGGPEPEIRIEASNDPEVLYARLEELGSRRAEKDAVLAAVWFLGHDEKEVHEREVDRHLRELANFEDLKVRPAVAKHITRTKLLEPGTQPGLVRLSRKGREQIRLLCGV